MLSRNHACMLMSQNFKHIQRQHIENGGLHGDNISILTPLIKIFSTNTDLTVTFANESFKFFLESGYCSYDDYRDKYLQFAIYGVFLSNFVFGYNRTTGKLALYTSSYQNLVELATKGILVGKNGAIAEELQYLQDILIGGKKYAKSIKDGGNIVAVRLDWEYRGTKLVFKPVIPRSNLKIDEEIFIPYTAYDTAMQCLNELLQLGLYRVASGDKVRVVTKNASILTTVYGEARTRSLLSYTYDARSNTFYVPSVGASIFSNGMTNLNLTKIDKIEPLNSIDSVDLSDTRVDMSMAREWCISKIDDLSYTDLTKFADKLGVALRGENEEHFDKAIVKGVLGDYSPYVIYMAMKDSKAFDLSEYRNLPNKWGTSDAIQVDIPSTVAELGELLKSGAYKITILTRNGSYKSIVCTNSVKILKSIYGDDYFKNYESFGNRLRVFIKEYRRLYKDTNITSGDLFLRLDKWGLSDMYDIIYQYYVDNNLDLNAITYDHVQSLIYVALKKVEDSTTVVKQPNLITARSCDCTADNKVYSYYKNIDLRSIKSLIQVAVDNGK